MFENASNLLWLIPVLPIFVGLTTYFVGPKFLGRYSHVPVILGGITVFVLSCIIFQDVLKANASDGKDGSNPPSISVVYYEWIRTCDPNLVGDALKNAGSVKVDFSLRLDPINSAMGLMVTFLGTMIAVFATGYLKELDGSIYPGYPRFFATVSIFLGAMLLLIFADNLLLLYAGWEGVGLCSYLLIGYWFQKHSACMAARKAFLVTRLGDVALLLGIANLWVISGYKLDYDSLLGLSADTPGLSLSCFLLFLGACGKSAQFPLHVWLPDAMEGPTPVSALIHAATMVTAGVYLLARFMPLFAGCPEVQMLVAAIGAITCLMSALIAVTQTDLKRILAYSTMSQLGYMFMALGCGVDMKTTLPFFAVYASLFHLITHAFFKALLFLSAGSVMHAMHHVIDLRKIGGLRKVLPLTHIGFLFGALALAGFPLFAGFWSKDEILSLAHEASKLDRLNPIFYISIWLVGITVAFLTALYTFRAYFLAFWGPLRLPEETHGHAHESKPVMTIPLLVLSVFALGFGFLISGETKYSLAGFFSHIRLPGLNSKYVLDSHASHDWLTVGFATLAGLLGMGIAWFLYGRKTVDLETAHSKPTGFLFQLSKNRFFIDEIYGKLIVAPLRGVFVFAKIFDQYILDGIVDMVAHVPRLLARLVQPIQNGLVQFYALAMVLAVAVFLLALARTM